MIVFEPSTVLEKLTVPCARLGKKQKAHCRLDNSSSHFPVASLLNPIHILWPYFPEIWFNLLSSTPASPEFSLPFCVSNQKIILISHLPLALYMPRRSHPWFDRLIEARFEDESEKYQSIFALERLQIVVKFESGERRCGVWLTANTWKIVTRVLSGRAPHRCW
jgi:hypothetical protein